MSVPRPSLDANKRGEMEPLPSPIELVARIPPPYYTPDKQKVRKERDSIKARIDQLQVARAATTSSTSQPLATIPTTTTILKVVTPEIVIPSIKEKGEPSIINEFKPTFFR